MPSSFFREDTFRDYVKQFKNQQTENTSEWEFYVKSTDFVVYRRRAVGRNAALYQYRSMGGWKDIKSTTLAQVYLDLDFRKKWDKNMYSHTNFVFDDYVAQHFEMKYPWPLSNREYAYAMERRIVRDKLDGCEYQVILGESLPTESYPERKGVIRIDTYMQNICIAPDEDGDGCYVFMDYFDDPKGNIPKSVINWAAKTGVPNFVNNLKLACVQYEKEHTEGDYLLDDTDVILL